MQNKNLISEEKYNKNNFHPYKRVLSSVVEQWAAVPQVIGSNPVVPFDVYQCNKHQIYLKI
jgi:hypothetical protein